MHINGKIIVLFIMLGMLTASCGKDGKADGTAPDTTYEQLNEDGPCYDTSCFDDKTTL